jgi:RNA polymerase sigma factor (sigma-70 family)
MRDAEDRIEARRVLGIVPPRQRAAIALRYLEDRPFKEVAELLGCREATARSLVKRGLDAIRMAEQTNPEEVKK